MQGLSAGLLAKLHYGVTQLLDEASSLLQPGPRDISRGFLVSTSLPALLRTFKYQDVTNGLLYDQTGFSMPL